MANNRIRHAKPPRLRACPRDMETWHQFERMARDYAEAMTAIDGQSSGGMPAILRQELDRLCEQGNPLALRFRKAMEDRNASLRAPDEPGKAPPPGIRLQHLKF